MKQFSFNVFLLTQAVRELRYDSDMEQKLYSYRAAAAILGLANASGVQKRLAILERRGVPLSVEAGEVCEEEIGYWGKRRILTERGLRRLQEFIPGRAGRPKRTPNSA